jgi:hypothetical protein
MVKGYHWLIKGYHWLNMQTMLGKIVAVLVRGKNQRHRG